MARQSNIETLNALSLLDFRARFWPFDTSFAPASPIRDNAPWNLDLQTSSTMSEKDFDFCFNLIRDSSSKQYAASSLGWHPVKKRQEMRLLDMKYILVRDGGDTYEPSATVGGFLSFMLTYEDGIEVVYCYELHLEKRYRGKGLGKCLMKHIEDIGKEAGVEKAMLTVFKANEAARGFYGKLGYEEDAFSPCPKRLRGGIVKESDYVILSKSLVGHRESLRIEEKTFKREIAEFRGENAKHADENEKKRLEEVGKLRDENARLRDENKRKGLEELGKLQEGYAGLEAKIKRKRGFG